jgi:cytochrome c-type biogenesis protein CcsB
MSIEIATFWLATVCYGLATLFVVGALAFKRESLPRIGWWLSVAGFALHTASISARWVTSGRLPFVQEYENILMGTWVVIALYVLVGWRWSNLRPAGVGVLPFVLLSLGVAATLPSASTPVTAPYKSIWLGIHVTFAWATYAAYTVCASLAIAELMRDLPKHRHPAWLDKMPSDDVIGERTLRFVGYGFLVNTVMIASGAIWAHDLWGAYWSWDPVETWSLLTWLAYGFYLHAYFTLGWRRQKLAWIAVLALFGVMMSFWGVQFFPSSFHVFRNLGDVVPQVGRPQ